MNDQQIIFCMKSNKRIFRRDNEATNILVKAGKLSSEDAIRSSKALGLTITYLENGWVIKETADGNKVKVKKHALVAAPIELKKGMILHVKK